MFCTYNIMQYSQFMKFSWVLQPNLQLISGLESTEMYIIPKEFCRASSLGWLNVICISRVTLVLVWPTSIIELPASMYPAKLSLSFCSSLCWINHGSSSLTSKMGIPAQHFWSANFTTHLYKLRCWRPLLCTLNALLFKAGMKCFKTLCIFFLNISGSCFIISVLWFT